MMLTVNGQAASPGCYVDGHWGQYGPDHLADQLEAFDITIDRVNDPRRARRVADRCEAYMMQADVAERCNTWRDMMYNAWEWQHEAGDTLIATANEVTEGGYWEWWEGEVFLRSYVCPECGRDARWPMDDPNGDYNGPIGVSVHVGPEPCDYCCDADDPGCFA